MSIWKTKDFAFISEKLKSAQWGDHVVSELADYLKRHNPKRRGYSKRTLYNSVRLYETYSSPAFSEIIERLQLNEFVQSPIAQLPAVTLPSILCLTTYTNHMEILNRCRDYDARVFYILYAAHQHLKQKWNTVSTAA